VNLVLRAFEPPDATALFQFMGDASAMQHTYLAPSLAHCLARLSAYEAMRPTLGFAPWVVCTQAAGEVVGWGGLSVDPDEPAWGLEVSYAFAPRVWGRGYATELVMRSLGFAFGVLSAAEVQAFAKPHNHASIRVLKKCGFSLLRFESSLQRDHYRVARTSAI
jgi:[ribosomal protein S5]-alanine N-acetyltransferase